jgi:hypothetical protein
MLLKFYFNFFLDLKKIVILFILICLSLIVDTSIGTIADFMSKFIVSLKGIFLFILISIITIGSIFLLQNLIDKDVHKIIVKSKYLSFISVFTKVVNYILIANLVIVILSVLIFSTYSVINLLITNNIIAIIGFILMSILSLKFIWWFRSDRTSIIILIYGVSFFLFSLSFFFGYFSENLILLNKPLFINPSMEVIFPILDDDPFEIFYYYYNYLITLSLIMLLFGSYILLNNYVRKAFRSQLIFYLSLSFILFFLGNLQTFNIIEVPNSDQSLMIYYIFQSLSTTASGIFIGYSFWKVANLLGNDNPIKKYLIMTAMGLILIFIITQGTIIIAPFPPFGLTSLSFVIIAIYLFNFGFYATALSLAHNIKLRETIKTKTKRNVNLLGSIGKAQMTSELTQAVNDVKELVEKEEKELENKTGIETSISDETIQDYMEEVLKEISQSRKRTNRI